MCLSKKRFLDPSNILKALVDETGYFNKENKL